MARLNTAGDTFAGEVPWRSQPGGICGIHRGIRELEKQLSAMDIQADYVFMPQEPAGYVMAGLLTEPGRFWRHRDHFHQCHAKDPEYPKRR